MSTKGFRKLKRVLETEEPEPELCVIFLSRTWGTRSWRRTCGWSSTGTTTSWSGYQRWATVLCKVCRKNPVREKQVNDDILTHLWRNYYPGSDICGEEDGILLGNSWSQLTSYCCCGGEVICCGMGPGPSRLREVKNQVIFHHQDLCHKSLSSERGLTKFIYVSTVSRYVCTYAGLAITSGICLVMWWGSRRTLHVGDNQSWATKAMKWWSNAMKH